MPADRRPGSPGWADVLSSLVVFMVALPLCIGIAQACGLPPMAGIVTGIVGGILVGTLSGSPLQVSGPAAGLIVLVIQFLDDAEATGRDRAGAVVLMGVTIALAGLIQVAAGAFRVGQWFRAVSPAVVEGMLAGIGLTIIAKQFHDMVDDTAPKKVVDALLTIPGAVLKAFDPSDEPGKPNHQEAAFIGVVTILILATWKSVVPKRLAIVPAAVVAVVVAVLINEFGRVPFERLGFQIGPAVDDHGGIGVERVEIKANVLAAFHLIAWPGWEVFTLGLIWKGAVTFAVIASAESLLCATAVDTMHNGPRTRYDRELMAQGVGNVVCGAIGSLPMTGVIVRSSANVDAGARSRLSTILHGLWLLLFVALLPGVLSRIPAAALAAILVYTGWKLLNLPGLVRLWRESRSEALVFVATAAGIVLGDLLTGVVLGVLLSAAKLLYLFSHLKVARRDEPEAGRVHLTLDGAATFLRLPLLAEALEAVPPGQKLHLHLDRVRLADHAIMQLLENFQKQYEAAGGRVFINWGQLHPNGSKERPSLGSADQNGLAEHGHAHATR
ncbi:MAG: SulP family inorganic anion transporter [Gemmataceae bacterium]|nr:SulP family inorganic anion transporter [Gemmataceae bacterium]